MSGLDPSAARALATAAARGGVSVADLSPEAARAQYLDGHAADQLPLEPVAQVEDAIHDGIRLRIWRGAGAPERDAPALLYMHGGGWVIGTIETHEWICRAIANRAGAVVVAPDYRLAPEAPFPAGLEDCLRALRHIHSEAASYGIDPARIAVGGDSAGGNLAASLALMSRDGEAPGISAQILFYPNTDQDQASETFGSHGEGFGLTAREMAWFRDHYLGEGTRRSDPRAAPLKATTLAGTAPAVIVLAGQDVLFSEGLAYARRLEVECGVSLRIWAGQIHGFVSKSAMIPEAVEAIEWSCARWTTRG
ncbi:alpha/beta hydrolase [Palleronia sp. LCG004]|uniref:alpha/beta hydrolase n=1 Tax=Palleronia sp. LCG004 TaxID=3079304 RepID=UPI002941FBB9|nr:alpha/beta hydrolase [Palleronia sp. LCG004]WOI58133.1 alpha/beta hydrolase [Palleronia sp. LCG004]